MQDLRKALGAANDTLTELMLGVTTVGTETMSPERTPTSYRMIDRIVNALKPSASDHFIDIGCGRGRVLCVAALQSMAQVSGVEINEVSAAAARTNLEQMKWRRTPVWSVTTGSALDFDYAGATILYFYNSVQGELLRGLLERIRTTITGPVRFVYVNPVCADLVGEASWLDAPQVLQNDRAGNPFALLYRSR